MIHPALQLPIALCSAPLLALSVTCEAGWPVAGFALVPWLLAGLHGRPGTTAAISALVGTTYCCLSALWLPSALAGLGASVVSSWSGLLATAVWAKALPFALLGGLLPHFRTAQPSTAICLFVPAVVGIETFVSTTPVGLPWALIGHSQASTLGVAQLAVAGGVPLISGLLGGVNLSLAWILVSPDQPRLGLASGWIAGWLVLAWLGLPLSQALRSTDDGRSESPHETRTAMMIQPDIARGERWIERLQPLHLRRLSDLTDTALRNAGDRIDFIVWPENVLTTPFESGSELGRALQRNVDRWNLPVITGMVRPATGPDEATRYRNSTLWLAPDRGITAEMSKTRSVPILESGRGRWIDFAAFLFGDARATNGVQELPVGGALTSEFSVTPVLCYEALFPDIVGPRRSADSLAILNLADDSWTPSRLARRQFSRIARFRAIEERLNLIRVSHGGLSLAIDAYGREIISLPQDTYAFESVELSASPPPSSGEQMSLLSLPILTGTLVRWLVLSLSGSIDAHLSRWPRRRRSSPKG
ncbi:MAG: apolipoprotein N-acyltransferase [bacterium]|nr:apolipoprotein N-acyltransferase [bacterium]